MIVTSLTLLPSLTPILPLGQFVSPKTLQIIEFFKTLFQNPTENMTAVLILSGVAVAALVGIAYLVKLCYEKYSQKA